jgi:hypothetical protein
MTSEFCMHFHVLRRVLRQNEILTEVILNHLITSTIFTQLKLQQNEKFSKKKTAIKMLR